MAMNYRITTRGRKDKKEVPYKRTDTFPPVSDNLECLKDGRQTHSVSATTTSEISLEEFDFFSKDSLFDTSDSEGEVSTSIDSLLETSDIESSKDTNEETRKPGDGNIDDLERRKAERNVTPIEHDDRPLTHETEILGEQDEMDSSHTSIKGNKTHTQFEKDVKTEIERKKDDPMTYGNITYKYETCSFNADGDFETEDCPLIDIDILPPDIGVKKSPIVFMLTDEHSEPSGMTLVSTGGGHVVEITDRTIKFYKKLNLGPHDKLLGIDYQAVKCYPHEIVLEMFKYLLYPSTEEFISLIVERQEQNRSADVLEIKIYVKVITRGGDSTENATATTSSNTSTIRIVNVKWKHPTECYIRHYPQSNKYITVDNSGMLNISTLRTENGNKNLIRYNICSGLCRKEENRKLKNPHSVFIGVFQIIDSKKFIMAAKATKLILVDDWTRNKSEKEIVQADPRYFIVTNVNGRDGNRYFESLIYRGSYWTFNGKGLQLIQCNKTELIIREDLWFTIISTSR
ncbi:uncharacterized protein LOC127737516 [Mytilus californianus]|uniref:uncharacterized protein LOC127737516 n=1 Tax=Mytilus californianus TaxID=6549 RepID=UPI002247ECE4|nr:uncharacterized protein LOC127737516 [Mytilus californianus]XP_052104264.1 uncharacterized protein LOC127737516 [Mytilus californianus]XP_052104266.1 uncharacterized protein LOC127737516 [Mytilus californianus]